MKIECDVYTCSEDATSMCFFMAFSRKLLAFCADCAADPDRRLGLTAEFPMDEVDEDLMEHYQRMRG